MHDEGHILPTKRSKDSLAVNAYVGALLRATRRKRI